MEAFAHVPAPDLTLTDATPVSATFGDVYFSRAGGVAETEHVFIQGNNLPERWQGRQCFTVAELGFGTGLNFLVAWKRFVETADTGAQLHYISIEKFPFTRESLHEVLALIPELSAQAAALLGAYPLRLPGIHRIHLPRVTLTLCFGDVAELLPPLTTKVDAWFLDGFSPAKNPDMWNEELLMQIGALSAPGATLATFTAAGFVRRGLAAAGFTIEKLDGFGHKRDMVVGVRAGTVSIPSKPEHVVVIGAGIAGATLARALAERGIAVTVLERATVANGASGNAAAVLFPQLTKRWNTSAAWYFAAYSFMLRQLQRWRDLPFTQQQLGMLRLPRHAEEEAQLQTLGETLGLDPEITHWVSREEASAIAGIALQTGGAYFPHGSTISPPECCAALLQHSRITVRQNTPVVGLTHKDDRWQVALADGAVIETSHCCVTAAEDSAAFLAAYGVRLNAVGGQVSAIAASDVTTPLNTILCLKGYVIPLADRYLTGATYHRDGDMLAVTQANHEANLAELDAMLPGWRHGPAIAGRSSVRATTPDRLPYIGEVDRGLYVSTGHGSRGMLSAPLAAEMIASEICGEQSPVTATLRAAVRPGRFLPR